MPPVATELRFGAHDEQVADLYLPAGDGPHAVVVLWHGGGFMAEHTRAMMIPAARDLSQRGVAAVNATYRRVGSGGGWPQTFEDADAPLDLADVTALGFSAGTPLAFHVAPRVRRIVNLAGVTMLELAARSRPGSDTRAFLGDPDVDQRAYAGADPVANLPTGVPSLTVHGDADTSVPLALSEAFVRAAHDAGDSHAELAVVPGAGHFDLHQPGTPGWPLVVRWLGL